MSTDSYNKSKFFRTLFTAGVFWVTVISSSGIADSGNTYSCVKRHRIRLNSRKLFVWLLSSVAFDHKWISLVLTTLLELLPGVTISRPTYLLISNDILGSFTPSVSKFSSTACNPFPPRSLLPCWFPRRHCPIKRVACILLHIITRPSPRTYPPRPYESLSTRTVSSTFLS